MSLGLRCVVLVVAVLISATLPGCATVPKNNEGVRVYWPPLPDEPKIEWLGSWRSQLDLPKSGWQKFVQSIAGTDDPISFNRAVGIVSDGEGTVYITDPNNQAVIVYDFKANEVRQFGGKDLSQLISQPLGITLDAAGQIYISDGAVRKIFVFDKTGKPLRSLDVSKNVSRPLGIAVDSERSRLIVCDSTGHKVEVFDVNDGKHLFTIGKRGSDDGDFNNPVWPTLLKNGSIVVSDSLNARVQIFDADGKFIRKFGIRGDNPGEFQLLKGIAADSEGHIYVVDGRGNNFSIFSEKGEYLLTVGGAYSASRKEVPGGFLLPQGIYIDKNNTIYVVDQLNFRFQRFQYLDARYLKEHPIEELHKNDSSKE